MTPGIVHPSFCSAGGLLLVRTPLWSHKGTGPTLPPCAGAGRRTDASELDRRGAGPRRATGRPAVASSSRARSAAGVSRSSSSAARTRASATLPAPLAVAGVRRRRRPSPSAVRGAPPQGQPGRGRRHVLARAPVPVVAVVVGQQGQAHGRGVPLLAEVADEDEVAERLRHLGAVETDQPDVEPQPHELLTRSPTRTGPSRTRGAGTRDPGRPRGCRSSRPSSRSTRAEHSMCQPGRPGPQRDSQAGSSGREGCQRTKSSGSRLLGSSGWPPCSAASSNMRGRP